MNLNTIQTEQISADDLTPYRGKWVVIRDGKVLESGLDPVELRSRQGVKSTDRIILVPSRDSKVLFL
jgi:hypothetical protein